MPDTKIRALAQRMMRVFVGSPTLHYTADFRNTTVESSGKRVPQYNDVAGAPTLEEFIAHLIGKKGLLVIPITKIGACRWGKLDVDIYNLEAKKFAAAVARWGLPLVVELSKSGGFHLAHYSPYTETAHDIRAKLSDWGAALHLPPSVEIFPKQERLLDGEKGSGINLPYFGGDDPLTRNYAIDKYGNRLTVEAWLAIIERMPAKAAYVPGQVNTEAAADLLAKHWTEGVRDNLNLAALGALLRHGVDHQLADDVVSGAKAIAADNEPRADANVVEKMMEAGKRVPGFPALSALMGQEEAREFMRLAGGRPPLDPLQGMNFNPVNPAWLDAAPPAVTYTINPLLVTGVVGLLVAEGGTGKSSFAMRMAVAVAGGREFFGFPTTQGRVVYISCEEHSTALQRRVHWVYVRELERMRHEGATPESIELFEQSVRTNLTTSSAVGKELYLISTRNGEVTQSGILEALIENLPRPLELLIMDPISRLSGGEENSNAVGTFLMNSAERIAQELSCTVLLAHHTGKGAAKDRDSSQYAARGASGLVDAARSSIRMMVADSNATKDFTNVPPEVVAAGDLIEVTHNKSNEGPRAKPFWMRRQGHDFDKFEPKLADGVEAHHTMVAALWAWFKQNGSAPFSATRVDNAATRKDIWKHLNVSRPTARAVIDKARDDGELVAAPASANGHPMLLFRDDYEAADSM